jgi:hypothetical protein
MNVRCVEMKTVEGTFQKEKKPKEITNDDKHLSVFVEQFRDNRNRRP